MRQNFLVVTSEVRRERRKVERGVGGLMLEKRRVIKVTHGEERKRRKEEEEC